MRAIPIDPSHNPGDHHDDGLLLLTATANDVLLTLIIRLVSERALLPFDPVDHQGRSCNSVIKPPSHLSFPFLPFPSSLVSLL